MTRRRGDRFSLEARGPEGRPPFRMRWEDTSAESLVSPGGG